MSENHSTTSLLVTRQMSSPQERAHTGEDPDRPQGSLRKGKEKAKRQHSQGKIKENGKGESHQMPGKEKGRAKANKTSRGGQYQKCTCNSEMHLKRQELGIERRIIMGGRNRGSWGS